MRPFILIVFLSLVTMANGQEVKPKIVGQKDLSTEPAKPITITLDDLHVEETISGNGDGNGGSTDDDAPDNDSEEEEEEEEEEKENTDDDDEDTGSNGGDNEGENDDGDRDEDGTKDDEDNEDEDDKKKEEDNNERDKDKDDKGDKNNKGNKDSKGGGDDKGKGKKSTARLAYPQGYTLEVFEGKNYTFIATTITPDPGFTGTLTVPVRVKNASHPSPRFDLKITVKPVSPLPNNPPVITGQANLTTLMDIPLTVKFSDLQVSDADDTYPDGFTLTLQPGNNYSVNQLTVTPSPAFSGRLTVPVTVSDGKNSSPAYELKITVKEPSTPNIAPVIAGQLPLSISMNQSVKIVLSHLMVQDLDNKYPDDFSLRVFPGANYNLNGTTVTPHANFTGELSVNVAVHDGVNESKFFPLRISVSAMPNKVPVITGQTGIKVPQGQSLEIKLSHLLVEDADNSYPEHFTLSINPGTNYSVANRTVTPVANFLGILTVPVTVHDGKMSSDPFSLKVEVIATGKLEIVGQKTIEMQEDTSISIALSHLAVNDPTNTFPQGFTLQILPGNDYDANNNTIRPHRDFTGNLSIPVTVKKGNSASPPFSLVVVVNPVNDAPELLNPPTDPLVVNGHGPWPLLPDAQITDADDDHLLFAEMTFDPASFRPGIDKLQHEGIANIHAVFDEATGVLFMVGRAPLSEYQKLIRSVSYTFEGSPDSLSGESGRIYLRLNDGKNASSDYERLLMFDSNVSLEIPSAFTPNNDNANDTWKITPVQHAEQLKTFVRVYDKNGNLVFEAVELKREWDGQYNGSPLPADVYFYTIEMDLSYRRVSYKGIVAILR